MNQARDTSLHGALLSKRHFQSVVLS